MINKIIITVSLIVCLCAAAVLAQQPPRKIVINPAGSQRGPAIETETKTPAEPAPIIIKKSVPKRENADPATTAKALTHYNQGMKLLGQGKIIQGRKLLSDSLASGTLPQGQADIIREKLSAIANEMIFSPRAFPGDSLTEIYSIESGDMLATIAATKKLSVPYQAIQRINSITNPAAIRVNQKIKLLKGPFNAIITKSSYTLDLYLQDIFVRSFKVGLGKDNSTPLGKWKVRDRMRRAPWTSPEGAVYYPGQSEYPLGREGIWIALQGMQVSNETFGGFGIHGTNEPQSIGKQESNGCVRLSDEDIALLYDLLANGSTVTVSN